MSPFQIGRLYGPEEFRVEWAAYFRRVRARFGLPTEAVVRGRGQFVVPDEARVFDAHHQLYLGRFPMTQDQLRARAKQQGLDFDGLMKPWPEWVVMVEVWTDHGDDGHTSYGMEGYRFVPESALDDIDLRTGLPRCMGLTDADYEQRREIAAELDAEVPGTPTAAGEGGCFVVACKDTGSDGVARYYLATRQTFRFREAAEGYAAGCDSSRDPIVVDGRFFQLRA